jgi:farnesyl-diphosphate farnesyltransferase
MKLQKLWELLVHPTELRAVIQWKLWHDPLHERDPATETPILRKCYDLLEMTSRSFVMVIQELTPELRVPVLPLENSIDIRWWCFT